MVDFTQKLKKQLEAKKLNPVEIYDSLDRRSETGPLRPSQLEILKEWFENRKKESDLIIKLHTGEGKTLIGLLMLQSKLNESNEPSLYLCPNIYLANQVKSEAQKFGIPYCEVGTDNALPDDFVAGKSILITHVQKLFHGYTIFGLDNKSTKVGSVILDDSHACIDSIKNSLTLKVKKGHEIFEKILSLFQDDLSDQGAGSYLEITDGEYNTMLPIPYWSWFDKREEVIKIISASKGDDEVRFVWNLIKDQLQNCHAFISGSSLEITPQLIPINKFGSFSRASNRILMSATTQDDAFAIKGLGLSIASIKSPLTNKTLKWSGEKMILIPTLIEESLDRDSIIDWLMKPNDKSTYGIVALTPDFKKNQQYEKVGAEVATSKTIFNVVQRLKAGDTNKRVVFVNRYDGIDLPDAACRILLLDSKPYFDSLSDRYEEDCRTNSEILNVKIAQRIEQGIGRGVRGEKDYCVILVLGGELAKFIKSKQTQRLFSNQTRQQIDIGMQVADFAKEEVSTKTPVKTLSDLIVKSLNRDEGWKNYYIQSMDEMTTEEFPEHVYDILKMEFDAETCFLFGEEPKACEIMQRLADRFNDDQIEKGWYLQQLARYKYRISKLDSNELQKAAFILNNQLLKPKTGINYVPIGFINENRLQRIKSWISQYDDFEELFLAVDSMLENLTFGIKAEKFEAAVQQLGEALGFVSQRPDKEIRKGPDNLWCGVGNEYFLIECKSEVEETRSEVSKHEAGQMNSHCGWFKEKYGDASCTRILIIPTKKLSYYSNLTHKVGIMRHGTLKSLKHSIRSFFMEFQKYDINDISDLKLQTFIDTHKLDLKSLKENFTESPIKMDKP